MRLPMPEMSGFDRYLAEQFAGIYWDLVIAENIGEVFRKVVLAES